MVVEKLQFGQEKMMEKFEENTNKKILASIVLSANPREKFDLYKEFLAEMKKPSSSSD